MTSFSDRKNFWSIEKNDVLSKTKQGITYAKNCGGNHGSP